ncbi:MAG: hypothetical protein WCT77_12165 [Bacteroidota bacterium]
MEPMNNVQEQKTEHQLSKMNDNSGKKLKKRIWKNILFEVRNQFAVPKEELVH